MYKYKDGFYAGFLDAHIQKSIKIDEETEKIILSVPGRSFSAKVRNMAAEYSGMKVLQKSN